MRRGRRGDRERRDEKRKFRLSYNFFSSFSSNITTTYGLSVVRSQRHTREIFFLQNFVGYCVKIHERFGGMAAGEWGGGGVDEKANLPATFFSAATTTCNYSVVCRRQAGFGIQFLGA